MLIIARRRADWETSRLCETASSRPTRLYWLITLAVQNVAVAPRAVPALATLPSCFTSLNCATQCGLDKLGGGAGWNCLTVLSTNGSTDAIHGVCGNA